MVEKNVTNRKAILDYLSNERSSFFCDDCLSEELSIEPRQQVNQICRQLLSEGAIERFKQSCDGCCKIKLVNGNTD